MPVGRAHGQREAPVWCMIPVFGVRCPFYVHTYIRCTTLQECQHSDKLFVNEMNSSTPSLSGRRSKTGCDRYDESRSSLHPNCCACAVTSCLNEFLKVFLRWLNPVFTTVLNSISSHPNSVLAFLRSLITADFTFGGGLNAPSLTVNRYSISYHACRSTERMP